MGMIAMTSETDNYRDFLASKRLIAPPVGFAVDAATLPGALFPFQRDIVRWALRRGRAAIFAGTGLGKTIQQLAWSDRVARHTGGDVLIIAPLAVAQQTAREGERFGIGVTLCREQADVRPGINVTNYERLHRFDAAHFVGVVLDECFAAGTEIDVLVDGEVTKKYIENIRIGDLIVNASGVDRVADVHRREVPYAVRVSIAGRTITCSPNHPFFTQRGWIGAQDLIPGDEVMATSSAVRMVRGGIYGQVRAGGEDAILRAILLSEMADEPTGTLSEGAYARSGGEAGRETLCVAGIGRSKGQGGNRAHPATQSGIATGSAGENLPHIESDAPRTFRAWGQWHGGDRTTTDVEGNTWRGMDSGVCLVTGQADSRLSHALQTRLGESRDANRHRSGWILPQCEEGSGREEGRETGFVRVDSLAILEPGNPELDQYRDADGRLYFYDLGATRHPSFSVNGILVHNSSILKNFDGATRNAIIEAFRATPFKLAATATPAPNDYMELGNHAEFLGVMSRVEMLSMFFVHDGGETHAWRLKGHAEAEFWRWICSWAVMLRMPSDLGYDDDGFVLPPLHMHHHTVDGAGAPAGMLFAMEARTLDERRAARRVSVADRVARCAELVNASREPWIVWCDLNAEADALTDAIPDAVEVRGTDDADAKADTLLRFAGGGFRVLVSKPSICGHGMNFQHCPNVAFVGVADSWEMYYQAIRRCWRFGQTRPVHCHVIASESEGAVVANLERKERDADRMAGEMAKHMADLNRASLRATERETDDYLTSTAEGRNWTAHLGDCVDVARALASDSVDYSIFSPPFASLYTYSNSPRDMGNARTPGEFYEHFGYLVAELYRVLKPGRLLSFHCANIPLMKARDGVIGIADFRGDLIRMFVDAGFIYHSEVVIWKDPVTAMQRTKALGLLYKQLKKDSAMSRQGIPDYLVTMRKPGVNPAPVTKDPDEFPVSLWQRYASPVWMDINPSETLQKESAREERDERHIAPLQLEVIRRAVQLWTNPGDLVLSPFMGIGSEGVVSLREGRRFVGAELKSSYHQQAVRNLQRAERDAEQPDLFSLAAADGGSEAAGLAARRKESGR